MILGVCGSNTPSFAQVRSEDTVYVEAPRDRVIKNLLYREPIYKEVDTYPIYPEGFGALQDFIRNNLKTDGTTGNVVATFVVEKDGNLSNIIVVAPNSFSDNAKAEALRVIELMPKWRPGIDRERFVRTQLTILIPFRKPVK